MTKDFDQQVGAIISSIVLPGAWRERMAELASYSYEGPSAADLRGKRRRLVVAFTDGGFSDRE